jgi:hypothetical protein
MDRKALMYKVYKEKYKQAVQDNEQLYEALSTAIDTIEQLKSLVYEQQKIIYEQQYNINNSQS